MMKRRHFMAAAGLSAGALSRTAAAVQRQTGASTFGRDFLWGAATAAYQIEGAAREDGRGESVWDVFCRKPGAVFEGHTGDLACDHYHRWKEDVALLRTLGVGAYRFSVAWPRVMPNGTGAINDKGMAFYDRLVDALLAANIKPLLTLFHWDFPQALFERGGWQNRDVANWFADYATAVARRLGDRVPMWVTQNEPQVYTGNGHLEGGHAPGLKLPFRDYLTVAHNSLRAHGLAVQALRAEVKRAQIGYVLSTHLAEPATASPEDVEAARQATWQVHGRNSWNNAWFCDPALLGRYPDDGVKAYGKDMPRFPQSDLDDIKQPLDFLGINIYTAQPHRRGADGKPEALTTPAGYPRSGVDWQTLRPAALYWGPKFFHERYKLPLYITESGLSTRDHVFLDGKVHDVQRIDYLNRALLQLQRAAAEGADVRGYFAWSLLDNFEWADGYKQRFGLVYVDYPTGRRVPKDSFDWYRRVIASRGRALHVRAALPSAQVVPG